MIYVTLSQELWLGTVRNAGAAACKQQPAVDAIDHQEARWIIIIM